MYFSVGRSVRLHEWLGVRGLLTFQASFRHLTFFHAHALLELCKTCQTMFWSARRRINGRFAEFPFCPEGSLERQETRDAKDLIQLI